MSGVEIGTAIVSYIEPHPGQAVAFNRWYELDHFPATVLAGPGVFAGARFVATCACKQARPRTGTLFGDPARGSYLSVAWVLPGHQDEWDAWVACQIPLLREQDRMFAGRDHVHTAVYRCRVATGDPSPGVALNAGLAGVVAIATTNSHDVPALVGHGPVVQLELERTIISAVDPPAHQLGLLFCAADPLMVFADVAGLDIVGYASPFLATIPGTDAYTDDL